MEIQINVVVAVNSLSHAEMIREDIIRVVEERTTLFFISDVDVSPKEFISHLGQKRFKPCVKDEDIT